MGRRWQRVMPALILTGLMGCASGEHRSVVNADHRSEVLTSLPVALSIPNDALDVTTEATTARAELSGPQPVEVFIQRALAENRTVQAAFHNVESLKYRLPQVTTLEDPIASNVVFPIPSVAPQYSLMGYNPYNLTLAQQFPWFGTLRLRGQAAEHDVQVALAELAAAQLDAVAAVKRAYFNLYAATRADEILAENRKILEDFRTIALERAKNVGSQQDVLRAELLITELDRERAGNQQLTAGARAALARQLHIPPDTELKTLPELPRRTVPRELEQLSSLALATRPELQGRLAAIARDEKAVELAKKRFCPNFTLGLTYMDMEKTNAVTPKTASGQPNVGLFVGFNLPVHHAKYQAGVLEAKERARADAKLFEAQRDETVSEIQDFLVQAKVQEDVLSMLEDSIAPRTRQTLDLARSDYAKANVDYATVLSALREVLQVQLQIAQVSAELGKALAGLERAVGRQINEAPEQALPGAPPATSSPFRTEPTALGSETPKGAAASH